MILTQKIIKALHIAAKQHEGQKRKDNITPFIVHPIEVAWLVSEYSNNEDIISAALLHDVVEDTLGYSFKQMTSDFGDMVTTIVSTITDPPHNNMTWNELHKKCLEKLKSGNNESVLIFLADKYTSINTKPIDLDRVWYYKEIIEIAKNREFTKNTKLLKEFEKLIQNY